jgi:hypothetical protein
VSDWYRSANNSRFGTLLAHATSPCPRLQFVWYTALQAQPIIMPRADPWTACTADALCDDAPSSRATL